jgi:hypothetical protein
MAGAASVAVADDTGLAAVPRMVTVAEAGGGGDHRLTVDVDGQVLEMRLRPSPVRAANFRVVTGDGALASSEEIPPSATYSGEVIGLSGSVAAASRLAGGWRIVMDLGAQAGEGRFVFVQPWHDLYRGAEAGEPGAVVHASYRSTDLAPIGGRCGGGIPPPASAPARDGYGARSNCLSIAEMAVDADSEYFAWNGSSVSRTVADIESVMNAVNVIYARDVGIAHVLTTIIVRNVAPDPYSATDAGAILSEFATHWQNNHSTLPRDLAHLMTGRGTSGVIGVAYLSAVCGYGYGYSRTTFTTNLAYRAGLTAHELGHNWGAGHCDGDSDCFIMCGGIGGCTGGVTRLGTRSMNDIITFRDAQACTAAGGPFATPVPAQARNDAAATIVGESVLIDVLANDADGNCEQVLLTSFSTATSAGGTITRSAGTGPDGRDLLRYVPPAGFIGTDSFTYSAADAGGAGSSAGVSVQVLEPRAGVPTPLAVPGLNATYYMPWPEFIPDLSAMTPSSSGVVATLNYPSSTGNFATSGRAINLAAEFTGRLMIPSAGTYTFFTESDDGTLLYVNDRLVVANDGPQGMTERAGSIALAAGPATVRVEYHQGGGPSGLIARVQGPGVVKQVIPALWWEAPGVNARYYAYPGEPTSMPNFEATPILSRGVVSTLNQPDLAQPLATSTRRNLIAARFTGHLVVDVSGVYRLFVTSDDGSEVFIGTDRVVANGGAHGMVERSGFVALGVGSHPLRVDYWQGGGGGGLILKIEGPGLAKQPVPASMLTRVPPGAEDCDADGVDDRTQGTALLDVSDLLLGGNGTGTPVDGLGVHPVTGRLVQPGIFIGSGGAPGAFVPLDGASGRINAPFVDGVFVPSGVTRISRSGATFIFSPTGGTWYNAIRNGIVDVQPIVLSDRPDVVRRGLGLHANGGVTFDLRAVSDAAPGGRALAFRGVAGINLGGCQNADIHVEFNVLVDDVRVYRRVLSSQGNIAEPFEIAIPPGSRTLSVVALDADGASCDHLALADAVIVVASEADSDSSGTLDACECAADFNRDGGVDGQDVAAFFFAFENGRRIADVNLDGGVTGEDVGAFFALWSVGGC